MIKILAMTLNLFAVIGLGMPASAQDEDIRPRMYVGRYIQLDPIMAPFQTTRGVRYEVVTVRLVIG